MVYVSDEVLGTLVPLVVYWVYAGFYHLLPPLDHLRLHSRAEESRNAVTMRQVIKGVLLQQTIQAIVALSLFSFTGEQVVKEQPPLTTLVFQFVVAMFVMDTWQFFIHRLMHLNKFLYKHIHSHHHRLVVPYAFGALYNHVLEGLLLDTVGGALSFLISGMTPRTAIYFFSLATIKTVDDHCGLMLPYNPFHWLFRNNAAYHDVHHQLYGTKFNFSQPFFVWWDVIVGTHMPFTLEKRPEGGFEARPVKSAKAE